ncbi:hypothetical protein ACFLX7_02510 [Chloroflexota bacterium]
MPTFRYIYALNYIVDRLRCKEKLLDDEELEYEGTIDTIEDSVWTMTIDGETTTVDVSDAEIEGEPKDTLVKLGLAVF